MNRAKTIIAISLGIMLFLGLCPAEENKDDAGFSLSLFGGPHYGGIIDNNDVDGVTSATKWGSRGGVRYEFGIRGHRLEIGLEHLFFKHGLTFHDNTRGYDGKRTLSLQELRFPLTYNWHFLRNHRGHPLIILRIGPYCGVLFHENDEIEGIVPDHDMNRVAMGIILSGMVCPLGITDRIAAGLYLDMYRGLTESYGDPYHSVQEHFHGALSTLGLGLVLKFFTL